MIKELSEVNIAIDSRFNMIDIEREMNYLNLILDLSQEKRYLENLLSISTETHQKIACGYV